MAWNPLPMQASEGKAYETLQGPMLLANGAFYMQYGSATQVDTTAVETSILLGSPSTWSGSVPGSSSGPASNRWIPSESASVGTMIEGCLWGTMMVNATPALRLRVGLYNAAGAFSALCDLASFTIAAAGAGSAFRCYWTTIITANAVNVVTLRTTLGFSHGSVAAGSLQRIIETAPQDVTAVNVTGGGTWDVRATYDASHADNRIQVQYGFIRLVG